jgi:hypothetical protein
MKRGAVTLRPLPKLLPAGMTQHRIRLLRCDVALVAGAPSSASSCDSLMPWWWAAKEKRCGEEGHEKLEIVTHGVASATELWWIGRSKKKTRFWEIFRTGR